MAAYSARPARPNRLPRVRPLQELETFARSLKKGQVQALAASPSQRHMEGSVWLCLLLSDAYVAPEDMLHSTDEIEAGVTAWGSTRGLMKHAL